MGSRNYGATNRVSMHLCNRISVGYKWELNGIHLWDISGIDLGDQHDEGENNRIFSQPRINLALINTSKSTPKYSL